MELYWKVGPDEKPDDSMLVIARDYDLGYSYSPFFSPTPASMFSPSSLETVVGRKKNII